MSVVLVDAKHFGGAFACARKTSGMRRQAAADVLGITYQELRRYERGLVPIPDAILHRVMGNGFILLRSKCGKPKK